MRVLLLFLCLVWFCSCEQSENYPKKVEVLEIESEYDSIRWNFYKFNFLNGGNLVCSTESQCNINLLSCKLIFVDVERIDNSFMFTFGFEYEEQPIFYSSGELLCFGIHRKHNKYKLSCNEPLRLDSSNLNDSEIEFQQHLIKNSSILNQWLLKESKKRGIL